MGSVEFRLEGTAPEARSPMAAPGIVATLFAADGATEAAWPESRARVVIPVAGRGPESSVDLVAGRYLLETAWPDGGVTQTVVAVDDSTRSVAVPTPSTYGPPTAPSRRRSPRRSSPPRVAVEEPYEEPLADLIDVDLGDIDLGDVDLGDVDFDAIQVRGIEFRGIGGGRGSGPRPAGSGASSRRRRRRLPSSAPPEAPPRRPRQSPWTGRIVRLPTQPWPVHPMWAQVAVGRSVDDLTQLLGGDPSAVQPTSTRPARFDVDVRQGVPRRDQPGARWMLAFGARQRVWWASLPVSLGAAHGDLPGVTIELPTLAALNDRSQRAAPRIRTRSPEMSSLVGYLGSRSFTTGSESVSAAADLLHGKTADPLAAAAGAYLLTASMASLDDDWPRWIRNLARWYPWLPDGSILAARIGVLTAANDRDLERSAQYVHEAVARGIPFYSLGMAWLVELLNQFAATHPDLARLLDVVGPVARAIDPSQPFTLIEVGT